jgi:hypothetical protein
VLNLLPKAAITDVTDGFRDFSVAKYNFTGVIFECLTDKSVVECPFNGGWRPPKFREEIIAQVDRICNCTCEQAITLGLSQLAQRCSG